MCCWIFVSISELRVILPSVNCVLKWDHIYKSDTAQLMAEALEVFSIEFTGVSYMSPLDLISLQKQERSLFSDDSWELTRMHQNQVLTHRHEQCCIPQNMTSKQVVYQDHTQIQSLSDTGCAKRRQTLWCERSRGFKQGGTGSQSW